MDTPKRGFKRRAIENIIRAKIKSWLKSIEDEELRKEVNDHYIVTGGAIASMLLGDMPNDFDIYFDNVDVAAKVAKYYVQRLLGEFDESIVEIKKLEGRVEAKISSTGYLDRSDSPENSKNSGKYKVLSITSNAITLSDKVQLVLRFVGDAAEIHKNYDYVHATNYFTEAHGLVLNQPALESLLSRQLRYIGSLYPVCSIFRIKKFINRGWTINAGETLKILFDVSKLDLSNVEVLKDQLTGVDTTYFTCMLEHFEAGLPIERTYLFDIINKVFDNEDPEEQAEQEQEEENN
jgi:hypothetical protein